MPFDYKKEYKEFYLPPQKPQLLEVPPMNYVAVRGHGDPNAQDGEYQALRPCEGGDFIWPGVGGDRHADPEA